MIDTVMTFAYIFNYILPMKFCGQYKPEFLMGRKWARSSGYNQEIWFDEFINQYALCVKK